MNARWLKHMVLVMAGMLAFVAFVSVAFLWLVGVI